MKHDWIIPILDDLIAYASINDLPWLAQDLQNARTRQEQYIKLTKNGGAVYVQ